MSTLVTHNPRFNAQLATVQQLAALPPPVQMGRWHKPIPHHELVGTILETADRHGMTVIKTKYALGATGAALFGVVDFDNGDPERCVSLGFRNSTDQSVALQAVAGAHVFVCDNLALSGDFETWARKNTTHVNLRALVEAGFNRFRHQWDAFDARVRRLAGTPVADSDAKGHMWDVFAAGILPSRLLDDAHRNYFIPEDEWTDCRPRTLWGVHNALTRTVRELAPTRQLEVTTDLGRHFGIGVS